MDNNNFTINSLNGTLDLEYNLVEEEEMYISKFHNNHSIYLFCTLEEKTAKTIIDAGTFPIPLKLYETPNIAKMMATNILNPVTLRFAVDLRINDKEYYYDQLTMQDSSIIKRFKNIQEFKSKCVYERSLVEEPKSKWKVIQYIVNTASKLYKNPQYI